jgi:ABC-type glutathione transport system ATPase component
VGRVQFRESLLRSRGWQDRPQFDDVCRWLAKGGTRVLIGIVGVGKTTIANPPFQGSPSSRTGIEAQRFEWLDPSS